MESIGQTTSGYSRQRFSSLVIWRSVPKVLGSINRNSSPKWLRISATHCVTKPLGAITSARSTNPRSFSSRSTKPCLDGLPQSDLIGEQIADTPGRDRASEGLELVRQRDNGRSNRGEQRVVRHRVRHAGRRRDVRQIVGTGRNRLRRRLKFGFR